jgi:hypothetical protein
MVKRIDVSEWPAWKIAVVTNAANIMDEVRGMSDPGYKAFRNMAERMIENGQLEYCDEHKHFYVPGPYLLKIRTWIEEGNFYF